MDYFSELHNDHLNPVGRLDRETTGLLLITDDGNWNQQLPGGTTTRGDHIAYRSEELEKDYTYCKEHGYKIVSDEIEVSPNFWEKGSRCFKIESPCAFCQMHADSFGS